MKRNGPHLLTLRVCNDQIGPHAVLRLLVLLCLKSTHHTAFPPLRIERRIIDQADGGCRILPGTHRGFLSFTVCRRIAGILRIAKCARMGRRHGTLWILLLLLVVVLSVLMNPFMSRCDKTRIPFWEQRANTITRLVNNRYLTNVLLLP